MNIHPVWSKTAAVNKEEELFQDLLMAYMSWPMIISHNSNCKALFTFTSTCFIQSLLIGLQLTCKHQNLGISEIQYRPRALQHFMRVSCVEISTRKTRVKQSCKKSTRKNTRENTRKFGKFACKTLHAGCYNLRVFGLVEFFIAGWASALVLVRVALIC